MKIGNLEVYGIIYKIENLINHKVYIGQTTQGFKRRYNAKGVGIERVYNYHKAHQKHDSSYNKHLLLSIEEYGFENFTVTEIIDYAFSEYELDIKEKCWIQYYNSFYNGYNMTHGGDDSMKGSENPSSRSVVQLSLEGEYIKTWDCMTDAQNELNIDKSKITDVCRKNRPSAGNFMWVYTEEYDKDIEYNYIPYKDNMIPIIQLDLQGNLIQEFISCSEASRKLNLKTTSINRCCNHERKSYADYIWIFKNEYDPNKDYTYNPKSFGKAKKILVFDSDMNYIETLNNIGEIIEKYGYSRTAITNHIVHRCGKSIKNHIFVYEDDYDESKKESYKIKRKDGVKEIMVFDSNMNYIETIWGMKDISNKYGYSVTSIKHNLYNQPNKIKEHIFIYKDEYEKQIKNNENSILR